MLEIFGSDSSICEPLLSKNCKDDNSLFCYLCLENFDDFEINYNDLHKYKSDEENFILINKGGIKFTIELSNALYKHETYKILKENRVIKNSKIFTSALVALIRWAKNNWIYERHYGYFDSIIISVMLAKIQILYPNVSLIELIERFFLTYLTWNYSIPIRLNDKIIPNENDIINVLSPTNPQKMLTNKTNKFTMKIIEKAMLE
uniref:polynucleotide adenylyltransferase n=1 Tax=Meloidogyne hapla TaxID=6305 RepID=A0A1I8BI16_MELHA